MLNDDRKTIFILGGLGVIGSILVEGLKIKYSIFVGDLPMEGILSSDVPYIQVDVTDYETLVTMIPKKTDVIINLVGLKEQPALVDPSFAKKMIQTYVVGTYNVLMAATKLGVKRVILASSNHVTGRYEKNGKSLLGREITVKDYPAVGNAYGAMKLCGEQFGELFATIHGISVLSLRIGTVLKNEVNIKGRTQRTILHHRDVINIFTRAIETTIHAGTYYAVSNNPGKPWDTENIISEL